MKGRKFAVLVLGAILLCGCENFVESGDINGIIRENDLAIVMRMNADADHKCKIEMAGRACSRALTGGIHTPSPPNSGTYPSFAAPFPWQYPYRNPSLRKCSNTLPYSSVVSLL